MSSINDQLRDVELALIKSSSKEEYAAYNNGKNSLRKTYSSDIDIIQSVFTGFMEHYGQTIRSLPEAEQKLEWIKHKICIQQFESIVKTLNFEQNKLDTTTFLYYLIGYVNDVIGKRSI